MAFRFAVHFALMACIITAMLWRDRPRGWPAIIVAGALAHGMVATFAVNFMAG